jgi:hypothetical protein
MILDSNIIIYAAHMLRNRHIIHCGSLSRSTFRLSR